MDSTAIYQVLLVVLILATIALIFVLVRVYMILTDLNDVSKKTRLLVNEAYITVNNIKSSVDEYTAIIKGFIVTITSMTGIKEIISFIKNKKERENDGK